MARLVGVEPDIVAVSLQRAREAHKIVSVTKRAWVPVPPQYRASGAPPRLHGASHQAPTGCVSIATPAETVLDLVEAPASGGGLGNVATVIGDLLQDGTIDGDAPAPESARRHRWLGQTAQSNVMNMGRLTPSSPNSYRGNRHD